MHGPLFSMGRGSNLLGSLLLGFPGETETLLCVSIRTLRLCSLFRCMSQRVVSIPGCTSCKAIPGTMHQLVMFKAGAFFWGVFFFFPCSSCAANEGTLGINGDAPIISSCPAKSCQSQRHARPSREVASVLMTRVIHMISLDGT